MKMLSNWRLGRRRECYFEIQRIDWNAKIESKETRVIWVLWPYSTNLVVTKSQNHIHSIISARFRRWMDSMSPLEASNRRSMWQIHKVKHSVTGWFGALLSAIPYLWVSVIESHRCQVQTVWRKGRSNNIFRHLDSNIFFKQESICVSLFAQVPHDDFLATRHQNRGWLPWNAIYKLQLVDRATLDPTRSFMGVIRNDGLKA